MSKKIGVFAQERQYVGRIFNNLSLDYIRSIEDAWGIPVIIPIFTQNLTSYIEMCDAFVFPGGPDIDPTLYSMEKSGSRGISPDYDRYLLSAMQAIFSTQKSILGICKGMQLMNIAHGGTMKQDIEEHLYHFQPERGYEHIDTAVIVDPESFLSPLFLSGHIRINSIHHQAIETLGEWLRVVARSHHDDEIEAIEHTSLPYYGVQWHPEYLVSQRRLFEWFIKDLH
jgi:putative glutamine amidotransferase